MADSEVLKKLKDIPFRIQTASLKERRNVVEGIQDVLSTPGITEAAVRFVCRTLTMTLHRYRDSTSQSYVKRLLLYLVTNHREWTLRNLIPLLLEISETLRNTTSTKNTAQSGLYALRWTTILAENALKALQEDVDYNSLVLSQANLLAVITANGDRKRHEKGYSMMHNSWSAVGKDNVSKWLDVLLKQAPDAGPHVCVAYSTLCRHYNDLGEDNVISAHKAKMLETFIKSLISVKTRPNSNYIKGCSDFLHLLTKSEVQDTLVPALHKAMLRSPETIIQAVGEVMNNLEVDLDGPIVEIGKSLIVNVHSKDAWVRSEAAAALERVSLRVSSPAAAHALLTYAFDEYNGASGKLTSSEDKIAVLYAVGVLSALCVRADTSGASALFALAAAGLARVLDADTHERTLCAALGALQRWAGRCSRDAPTALLAIYKKGLSLKSTVGAVRTAYTSAMVDAVRGAAGGDLARELWPPLSAAAEKAQQQPLQPAIVSEGLVSLLGLVSLDAARAQQLPCWAALTHTDKHVLLHDRVLTAATDDVLAQVVLLCATVLETCPSVANEKNSPIYRAFILMLLSPIKAVRACAVDEAKKLLANQERGHIARYLMEKLTEVLEENKYLSGKEKTPTEDKDKSSEVTGKMILDCVHALCSFRVYPRVVVQSLLVCALPACHAPLVACSARGAWRALCTQLRVVPAEVIADNDHGLNETYVNGFSPTPTMSNIVCTLISACPERVSARAVQRALDILQDEALLRVTRDEYFTYLTPDTELYDKSVVPGNEDNSAMNLKRESKAYSYKEQLEELQLRRELAEKRKLEGKVKEVPLSAKQKEAMKAQLAKEAAIRQRLTELNSGVQCALGLVDCVSRSCPSSARRVVGALLWSLRSPLCAAAAAQSYLRLRTALAPQLPPSLPVTVLRLHKPACDLDPSWEQEPLAQATAREIQRLHAATVAPRLPAGERSKHHTLDAPAFYYVFPLLQQGVSGAGGKLDEATVLAALAVISEHAAALAQGPLPVQHMFQLLIDLISTSSGRIQTAATAALLEVGRSAMCAGAAPADLHCLLTALQAPAEVVRDASLRALSCVSGRLGGLIEAGDDTFNLTLTRRLYVATFDVSEDNKELAQALWESVPQLAQWWEQISEEDALAALLEEVQQPGEPLQLAAAAAAAARVAAGGGGAADNMLQQLQDAYKQKLPLIPAKLDQFGHVVSEAIDEWESRRGVAHALHALGGALRAAAVPGAMAFFVELALADRAEPVRARMLAAAMAIVDLHGKETLSSQLPVFEKFLDRAPKSGGYDAVRESVVLLMGSLARHLEPHDARIRPITLRLVAALSTPSQQVQEAVSNCLPHLVSSPALEEDVPAIVNKLMKQLLTADKYGDRKGAAYGIAGIVKGLGILSLKQLDVMGKLTEAIQEKKNYKYREGALFGFEMLCHKLGRLFEPYIVHVLPHLLLCFGDSSQYVRAAADDAAKLIMSRLSAHGVKLVLPALLNALHDDNWRTKAGSIELLGAMAYCAPKQLSSCLPSIVPKLIEVLSDSHERVQRAAGEALRVIGSVIRNPEIQAIVAVLLRALQEPGKSTAPCLATLLDTKFVHFIDAPSLALIMPVVQRAFLDRSTETRKMAAQIIGNMYSLTDQKDLTPYLPHIMPGLKASLLDPVPEVRAVSARALGAMVRGLGEASFDSLLPWLMHTLTSEASSVDRSGAAQGLAELVAGLGVHKLHKIMPEIIATAERTDIAPHVKDGYIMMFIYMPGAFTDEFTPYISQIINPILKALADENEYVRETALKAGQRIVTLYAESAIALLLPELERGLFDDNWRIRYSSVQLLGDLLYRISGVSGKMSTETASDDDNFGTEQSHGAIITALGVERRNRVLAGLYMGRSDVALMVRQAALHVWKVVVTNTPKTLREILPTLFGLLLGCLASTSYDKRQVAARTLGDLVRKLGERVVPEIVPILERGLLSERADQRQGVCIGLGEIVASTSRDAVLGFADRLVPTLRAALLDPLPAVRAAAARTFDALHAAIGARALDDVLPPLLKALHDEDPLRADYALDGLKQIMLVKSRAVLPYLVPVVCGGGDTRALSALAAAAGPALARHLPRVLPALLAALQQDPAGLDNCRDALLPVLDPAGVRCIIETLLEATRSTDEEKRRAGAALLCAYVSHSKADLAPHIAPLLRGLLALQAVEEIGTLQLAWEALFALTKSLSAEQLLQHVADVRHALRALANDLPPPPPPPTLPGFCLPKGITPILPLFREAILNGLPEDKESAALMLGEVIRLTSPAAIQPCVVHITGPLIRILGDRFNASVKAAVLETLAALLSKVGVMLKQFLPQLQTTFLKALHDNNRAVRLKAGAALAHLVAIHTRADPLFAELAAAVKTANDEAKETHLQALRGLLTAGGSKLSEPLALSLLATLANGAAGDEPAAAGCLGALLHALPAAHRSAALQHHVLAPPPAPADDAALLYRATALYVALKETPDVIYCDQFEEKIEKTLLSYLSNERVHVAMAGVRGAAYLLRHLLRTRTPPPPLLLTAFTRSMNHQNNEVKQLVVRALGVVGREALAAGAAGAAGGEDGAGVAGAAGGADVLRVVLPALVNGTKEKSTIVRANAELALRTVATEPAAALLEPGARAALADVMAKLGRRAAPPEPAHDELDSTLLT